ncbi:MAG: hypothetical protein AAFX40_09395 [Cyanobacteria bacterium J06639_1]
MNHSRFVVRAIANVTMRSLMATVTGSIVVVALPHVVWSQTLTAQELEFENPNPPQPNAWPTDTAAPAVPAPQDAPFPTQPAFPNAPSQFEAESAPPIPTTYTYQQDGFDSQIPGGITRGLLPAGTVVPVRVHRQMVFPSYQELNTSLVVAEHVTNEAGQVMIPAGSLVWGRFEPVREKSEETIGSYRRQRSRIVGSRFVADRIEVQSASYSLAGESSSQPLGTDPRADVGDVALKGAGYGAAGGVALGVLTGGVGFIPMLLAGGFGGAAAGVTNVDRVVNIEPDTTMDMVLAETLVLK